MKKFWEKRPVWFAVFWIVVYVGLFSLADGYSEKLGTQSVLTAPLAAALSAVLALWVRRHALCKTFGLCRPRKEAPKAYLYFLPLVVISSVNLWNGVSLHFSPLETALYAVAMLGAAFCEEVIFRGFLFRALAQENQRSAIWITSLTFGLGHIVNLLNGADFFPTLLQLCYACSLGFLFVALVLRSGSLLYAFGTHAVVNVLSAFSVQCSRAFEIATAAALIVLSLGFGWYLYRGWKNAPEATAQGNDGRARC